MPGLNLTDADTTGFDAMPAGTYPAEVFQVDVEETEGGEGKKLPAGVPMWNIQFRITHPDYENRRVFNRYVIPEGEEFESWVASDPKNVDKAKKMAGGLVNLFIAVGYEEDEVRSGDFDIDPADLDEKECAVTINRYEYPKKSGIIRNGVVAVKPISEATATAGGLL